MEEIKKIKSTMLGVVLINYKNINEVVQYVTVELTKIQVNYKIIIVDNSCDDLIFDSLVKYTSACNCSKKIDLGKKIFAIQAHSNLGYAKANNLGAKFLIKNFNLKYLLFSNTDIKFYDSNTIEKLIQKIQSNEKIGFISPKIIGNNNRDQAPAKYQPFFKNCIYRYLLYPFVKIIFGKERMSDIVHDAKEGSYYRLSGSFLLCDLEKFIEIDLFDEGTFLYGEELIIAEKLSNQKLLNYYYPKVKILHFESQTIKKYVEQREVLKQSHKSKMYYYSKYRNINKLFIIFSNISFYIYLNIYLKIFNSIFG